MKRLLVGVLIELLMIGCSYASKKQMDEISAREQTVKELRIEVKNAQVTLSDLEEETDKESQIRNAESDGLLTQEESAEESLTIESYYRKSKLTPAEADAIIKALTKEEENLKAKLLELQEQTDTSKTKVADIDTKTVKPETEKTTPKKNIERISSYKVKRGDYLCKIAEKSEIYGRGKYAKWKDIYKANKDKIKDPNLIQPGWNLKIPRP